MGYALCAVGSGRIVLIANTAYGATAPEKLPFNMRHRSAPASYKLKKDHDEGERAAAKAELIDQLVDWIGSCLKEAQQDRPAPVIPWHAQQPHDPGVWFDKNVGLKHQGFHGNLVLTVVLVDASPNYVRLLPSGWTNGAPSRDRVHEGSMLSALGRWQYGDGGLNTDGALAYAVIDQKASPRPTTTLTQYFKDTGEVWGVDASAITVHNGKMWLASVYMLQQWAVFLGRHLRLYHHFGAKAPIHVRIGLTGLSGTIMSPLNRFAIDASFEFRGELKDYGEQEQMRVLTAAYNVMREAYGVGPVEPTEGYVNDLRQLLFHPPK